MSASPSTSSRSPSNGWSSAIRCPSDASRRPLISLSAGIRRLLPVHERGEPSDRDQQHGHRGPANRELDSPLTGERGARLRGPARRQEVPLRLVQVVVVVAGPPLGLDKSLAGVEVAWIASRCVPLKRGLSEPAMDAKPDRVLADPSLQPWPTPDERLVGDVDDLLAGVGLARDEQPGVRQLIDDRLNGVRGCARRQQLGRRRPAARVLRALARFGQAQQHPSGGRC